MTLGRVFVDRKEKKPTVRTRANIDPSVERAAWNFGLKSHLKYIPCPNLCQTRPWPRWMDPSPDLAISNPTEAMPQVAQESSWQTS